ncbi:MAG: hypothetical protein AB7S26_30680 [Sandaracinaceae bacterium]
MLTEAYHADARTYAQRRGENHSAALEAYRERVRADMVAAKSGHPCPRHLGVEKVANNVAAKMSDVVAIFDRVHADLADAFQLTLAGNRTKAGRKLAAVVDAFGLKSDAPDPMDETIWYRGRLDSQDLRPDEMFHIPFAQRFRVENQRFSIAGWPMLYLGTSVMCVAAELRILPADVKRLGDLQISSFALRDPNAKFRLLDLTNGVSRGVEAVEVIYDQVDTTERKDELSARFLDQIDREFARVILASHCAFRNHRSSGKARFVEEYVLPQLVLEWAHHDASLDGVRYLSTHLPDARGRGDLHRTNVALVPQPSHGDYDQKLRERFEVSVAQRSRDAHRVRLDDIDSISRDLVGRLSTERLGRLVSFAGMRVRTGPVFDMKLSNGSRYADHPLGVLEMSLLHDVLLARRARFYA